MKIEEAAKKVCPFGVVRHYMYENLGGIKNEPKEKPKGKQKEEPKKVSNRLMRQSNGHCMTSQCMAWAPYEVYNRAIVDGGGQTGYCARCKS